MAPLGPTRGECSGLALNSDSITGTIQAEVGFDGYFPADGKSVAHEYRVDARVTGGSIGGTYGATMGNANKSGTVSGTVVPAPEFSDYWVMDLQMENGANT